jgi:hypothetical protein
LQDGTESGWTFVRLLFLCAALDIGRLSVDPSTLLRSARDDGAFKERGAGGGRFAPASRLTFPPRLVMSSKACVSMRSRDICPRSILPCLLLLRLWAGYGGKSCLSGRGFTCVPTPQVVDLRLRKSGFSSRLPYSPTGLYLHNLRSTTCGNYYQHFVPNGTKQRNSQLIIRN